MCDKTKSEKQIRSARDIWKRARGLIGERIRNRRAEKLEHLFIDPHDNIIQGHPNVSAFAQADKSSLKRRWHSNRGQQILEALSQSNFGRNAIVRSLGMIYGKYDLRGAPLRKSEFASLNLSSIDFFAADLQRSNFRGARLDNSYLSEADIRGAIFDFASMEETLLDNVRYDRRTRFVGVDYRNVNFNLAALLQEQVKVQQRIDHLKSRHPISSFVLWATCDYGQSLLRFSCWVAAIVLAFALAYYSLSISPNITDFFDAIYFSVVTFTTLGFGDIFPERTLGKILVMVEVALGYIMGGLLIAILIRRTIGN